MDAERMNQWTLALSLAAGFALRTAYFVNVRWTSDRLAAGLGAAATIAVILCRFVLLAGALALAAWEGALPLLLTALGLFIARALVMRVSRMAPT
jgi:hypothetical protein